MSGIKERMEIEGVPPVDVRGVDDDETCEHGVNCDDEPCADCIFDDGFAAGQADMQRRIVEFLSNDTEFGGESCSCLLAKRDAIEAGEHTKDPDHGE